MKDNPIQSDLLPNRLSPEARHQRDPQFAFLVDFLTQQIVASNYTPTELREAAILASIRYETRHARPSYLMEGESLTRVDGYHGREPSC